MTANEDLAAAVKRFPFWYHRIELPGGVVTPGWAPMSAPIYRIPEDLGGKRVLDVGAWDGYWSFQALRRGAREVVAIDDFSDYLGTLKHEDRCAWTTFDFCREALGYDPERCARHDMSVYDVSESTLGRFDVVFFFGTLYHLCHPLLALERLAAITDGLDLRRICDSRRLQRLSRWPRQGIWAGRSGDGILSARPIWRKRDELVGAELELPDGDGRGRWVWRCQRLEAESESPGSPRMSRVRSGAQIRRALAPFLSSDRKSVV